jgi:pimeloyl-ACP methyl ester carboxylesterase
VSIITMHPRTASAILSAVQETLSDENLSSVTIVGHSLGGALALLNGLYLGLQLPKSVTVKVISYGMPRVGNQAFADFIDSQLSGRVTHVNNKEDAVPIVPGRFLGFHHPSGEIHIQDSGAWDACPGAFFPPTPPSCIFVFVWCGAIDGALRLRKLFRSGQYFQLVHRRRCEQHL